ncbi:MAG: amidohydrolase [candidate division WOR-3 bacterium]
MCEKLILKARFVILNYKEYIENGYILVENGIIKKVGKVNEIQEKDASLIYDFKDAIIAPGFINTHTHAAMVGMRGMADDLPLKEWLEKYIWPTELKLVDRDFIRNTLPLALAEMISSGITTYVDMYFFEDTAAEIVKEAGIRAVLGEGIIDGETPAFKTPNETLDFVKNFYLNYERDNFIFPAVAPHAPYSTSKETLLRSKELAVEFGMPLLIHVAETQWEFNEIRNRTGLTPFAYLKLIGFLCEKVIAAHSVWIGEDEFEIIKNERVNISHNPESNAKLASGIAPVTRFIKEGINVTIGTDGACSNNNLDIIEEMRTASLLQKVKDLNPESLSSREIFKMATENAALALGLHDKLGTIESGKWADLVVLSLHSPHMRPVFDPYSHIVYSAKSTDVKALLVNGKLIYLNGEFLTIDIEKAYHDVAKVEERVKREILKWS